VVNKKTKEFFWFFVLVFLSLLFYFFEQHGWLKDIRGWLERPLLATEEKIYGLKTTTVKSLGFFTSQRKQKEEILKLEGKLRQMAVEQNQLSSCLEENERIKKLLGAPLPASWKFLPARVVGFTGQMRLNKGEKDGVKQGMMVVSENILVGRVAEVYQNSCLVTLPITPNIKIPVVVKRPYLTEVTQGMGVQAHGILTSLPGQKLILDRVLQQEDIQKGDLVVTSDDWLPDLVIGQIEEVLPKTAAIYRQARVSPLVDYRQLEIVFIVIN